MRPSPFRGSIARVLARGLALIAVLSAGVTLWAQIPGRNVNMVAGTDWPGGDPFLQRQNEPSIAASTRNPLHLVAGSNDYRTVDLPGLPDGTETGDAWVSVYKSFDGGQRWSSTLMPGYPQDTSPAGLASPIKGYQAAADPVVRAGTRGLVYYNGLVFDRGENGKSGIFLARFIDRNNKENGDPIAYLGTSLVASSDGATFLDKPWMAVDIPRGNGPLCVVGGTPTGGRVKRNGHRKRGHGNGPPVWLDPGLDYVPAGAIYVAYTAITGDGATLQAQIFVKRSMDCGATWSAAMRVSQPADAINQGASLAIAPATGDLFVTWRRFATPTAVDADAVMVSRLRVNASSCDAPGRARGLRRTGPVGDALERIFEHRKRRARVTVAAPVEQIDQSTSPYRFRTNAYPTMAIDGTGRAYVAWSERGYAAARPDPVDGDARILVATTLDGRTFTAPVVADDQAQLGHQLMPSLAFAGGKLMLVYYDLRETAAQLFGRFVDDAQSTNGKRNTIDIRASLGTPGAAPSFAPSVRVSDYLMGYRNSTAILEQLQVNPPNLPMFKLGTVPFIGDYIDVAAAPAFVPTASGDWVFNTAASAQAPVFHAAWTDNRDVRPPLDGNWVNYTPPTIDGQMPGMSLFDPSQTVAVCRAGNAGSRNQNIYTARIGGGLLVGAPGNTKPLSPSVQRGFVVFAQNQTTLTKTFRMTVLAQPAGGRASFDQFPRPPYTPASLAPRTFLDVRVPPKSTASRTLYVTGPVPDAQVTVDVSEVTLVGGPVVAGGLTARVLLNPDIENPDIENPDIDNPDIENPDIENAEVYNPDIENPDIENPDIENPDIENPDIENPDIENVVVANPDIENIGIGNPDIENPDIENPDIENPGVANPDIENGAIADVTWSVSNIGNTTAAFNVNLFLNNTTVPAGLKTQLVVYKIYQTPVLDPNGCDLRTETRNLLLFNVPSPNFISPGEGLPNQNDPSDTNATLWLAPGEVGRVTLRVFDDDTSNNLIVTNLDGSTASIDPAFNPATAVTAGVSGQGVDVLDPAGATRPPVVTTTGTNLVYLQQPSNVIPGATMTPAVSVRVYDNAGTPLPGVQVTIALVNAPGAVLTGALAVSDANGIATFGGLSVNIPVVGAVLRATATSPGVVAAGTSAPFNVVLPITPATVVISNTSSIFNGLPKPVTITTGPLGLATAVTYNGSPTEPSAIGAYFAQATVTAPGYTGGGTAVKIIASTPSGGGPGGGPYARSCSSGAFAVGFGANNFSTYGLLNARLECETGGPTERFVLDNNNPMVMTSACAPGQVMVGFHGLASFSDVTAGPFVKSLGARCQDRAGAFDIVTVAAVGISGDPFGPFDCPAGQAVVGVVGGAGAVLDSVALVCGGVSVPGTAGGTTIGGGGTAPVASVALTLGQQVAITATGLVQRGDGFAPNGPNGDGIGCPGTCLAPGLSTMALVARVGTGPWQFVGSGPTVFTATTAGTLQFGINDNLFADNTGALQVALGPTTAGANITSVSPSTGASQGFLVLRGTAFPATAGSTVLVSNGATWATGFLFLSPSSPAAYYVRLPSFPLGAATIQIVNGASVSNAFPITVSATPGTPAITTIFNASFAPTTTVSAGQTIYVSADGIDTTGVTVRFSTPSGALIADVSPSSTSSSDTIGVASQVVVPTGVSSYPSVQVSIRQGSGAYSAPVTLTVASYSAY